MARARRGSKYERQTGRSLADLGRSLVRQGVWKPKGPLTERKVRRQLAKPGRLDVATGEAKALKVGTAAARKHKTVPHARDRVIVAERPQHRVYARKGRVYEVETDASGRTVRDGGKRRIPLEPYQPGRRPEGPIRGGRGRQRGWIVSVNGYPSTIFFASYEQAEAFARRYYQRPTRASRIDPEEMVVAIEPMQRSVWDELMDERDHRLAEQRRVKRERERTRRAAARGIRPFR